MKMKFFVLFFLLSLGACFAPTYTQPTGTNIATLKVTTKTADSFNQSVRVYKNVNCDDYPGDVVNLLYSKVPGNDTKETMQTTIRAGNMITISVFAGVPRDDSFWEMFFKGVERTASENRHCEAFASFVPEPGAVYHAIYKIDGSPCSLNIMKIENGQGKTVTNARPNQACSVKANEPYKKRTGTKLLTN